MNNNMNAEKHFTHQDIIDLTENEEEIIEEKLLIKEDQCHIEEEQCHIEEEQCRIKEEQRRNEEEQCHIKEEQRRIQEEQHCIQEEQRHNEMQHNEDEQQLEAARHRQIAEEEQQPHMVADRHLIVQENDEVRIENERRVQVRLVANQITAASATHYIPCEKQVRCVTEEHYTVLDALTIGGDHHTPCRECLRNDPDECFWILTSVGMNMLGRQVRTGKKKKNKQVRYFLYKSFVEEEYDYLRDRRMDEEENIFEFRGGLPRFPLPF